MVNNFITLPSETIFLILAIHSELMPLGHLAILMGTPMIWTANASLTKINLRCLISLRTLTFGHNAAHNNNSVSFLTGPLSMSVIKEYPVVKSTMQFVL